MAKVEMSLNEYNAMKEELDFLRRVVKEITTPVPSDWDMNYARDYGRNSISPELTHEVREYLTAQVNKNLPERISNGSFEIEAEFSAPNIVTIKRIDKPEDPEEEGKDGDQE